MSTLVVDRYASSSPNWSAFAGNFPAGPADELVYPARVEDGRLGPALGQVSRDSWQPVTVSVAETQHCRHRATQLIERRYRWRGYGAVGLSPNVQLRHRTFSATVDRILLGTLTVALDGANGMNCETLFAGEVDALRLQGQRLCEFIRLAVDTEAERAAEVLTALFHAAFAHARVEHRKDTALIEVNPRHVRYYARRYGAQPLSAARHHAGVDAPAVLMALDLARIERQASELLAGRRRVDHTAPGPPGLPGTPA